MRHQLRILTAFVLLATGDLPAEPNVAGKIDRPLRYTPDGGDFVIVNGKESFNRPLYGSNTAFRVDAGDRPEFSFYAGGRLGNLWFGAANGEGKQLHQFEHVEARYRPGEMRYILTDRILGKEKIELVAIPPAEGEGLIVRAELIGTAGVEFFWAFGGISGQKGSRDGDIGTEKLPVREFFQFKPVDCKDNIVEVTPDGFTVTGKPGAMYGRSSPKAAAAIGPGESKLGGTPLETADRPTNPIAYVGTVLKPGQPLYVGLNRQADAFGDGSKLAEAFAAAQARREKIAGRLLIDTPDAFINAAAGALNVAADGTWDTKDGIMHGAVAWRRKYLGWRGVYWPDALGQHERFRTHVDSWFAKQNQDPVPTTLPTAENNANLSRNETALHSNGDLTKTHYDMNLVAIDGLFRHLLWIGDAEYAKQVWSVIERHLAWERRLFRRPFGKDGEMPLYEAYACIWASDDLSYNGGGATHATAYNLYHNRMAAKVARWIGKDPAIYEAEAAAIEKAMNQLLWRPELGIFAESKDWLGDQKTRDVPAGWTFYHTIDSEAATLQQGWQMSAYVDRQIPHIPLKGPGLPDDGAYTIATSNWQPYHWSTNNVVLAEAAHTALAYFQIGRSDEANKLLKGLLYDSMFTGLCPGNVGMCTGFDAVRGETQRDFADGCGALSRTLVEGLFGLKPDAIAGELTWQPGFPQQWDRASIKHASVEATFNRKEQTETYTLKPKFGRPMALRLRLFKNAEAATVTVNGQPAKAITDRDPAGNPITTITAESAQRFDVVITWGPAAPKQFFRRIIKPETAPPPVTATIVGETPANAEPVDLSASFNDRVTQIFKNEYLAPRSPFCSLAVPKQGIGTWCKPAATFEVDDAGLRAAGGVTLPGGAKLVSPREPDAKNVLFTSQWNHYPRSADVPLDGKAKELVLLMVGTTSSMQSRVESGRLTVTYTDGSITVLSLENPTTWWPLTENYLVDDYAFKVDAPLPFRVYLKTGDGKQLTRDDCNRKSIPGGAATALKMQLSPDKTLKSLRVEAAVPETLVGLMAATLVR